MNYIVIWRATHYNDEGGFVIVSDWEACKTMADCERLISDYSVNWDTHMIMRIEPEYYNMIQKMFLPLERELP